MEIKQKVVSGNPIKTYKKGSIPNDGLMALMYAYMAYKFDITNGYTDKPSSYHKKQPGLATIARISRRF